MRSMQCNVGPRKTHESWSSWPVAGPPGCKLTSSPQSGIEYVSPNIISLSVKLLYYKIHIQFFTDVLYSCLLFKTQLNSIGLPVPDRKHNTSLIRRYNYITITILDLMRRTLFKTRRFGVWNLSPFTVKRQRSDVCTGPNWVRSTWRRRQNPVSETSYFKWKTGRWKCSEMWLLSPNCLNIEDFTILTYL
jgi:hypothetical protein